MGKSEDDSELCGRCAMSSVSGVVDDERDPFEGERIEVEERELRKVSPSVLLGRARERIDSVVSKFTYGR
jgi:hypothetical protein